MTIYLPKGALITIDGVELSDHNRSPAQIDYELIQSGDRIVDSTLRRRILVHKTKLAISWELLPALDEQTVDGKAGRNTLSEMVSDEWNLISTFRTLSYKEVDSQNVQTNKTLSMMIDSYSEELVYRHNKQLWNVNMTLVEV